MEREVTGCRSCPFFYYDEYGVGICNESGNPDGTEDTSQNYTPSDCPLQQESITITLKQ